MLFQEMWQYILANIQMGQSIDNWTKDKGFIGDQFTIVNFGLNYIEIDTPKAQNIQRVSRQDFHDIYNVWDQYLNGTFKRHQIRDLITRFSKYIISILHWVEIKNGGKLP